MPDRTRLAAARFLAVFLSLGIAAWFLWAAWTDGHVPRLAWFGFAAVQFFSAAIMWSGRRERE